MEGEAVEIQTQGDHVELEKKRGEVVITKGSSAGDNKSGKKRKQRELSSPTPDRPARERKSIERFVVSPDKEIKEFKIQKGAGTALKDIPNIVFKLSKRRGGDEVVQSLHKVLFGKTAKHVAKANILQFSGYVWSGNEEKEKAKIKERLERCVKESLLQISDLLDLNLSKSLKKEDGILRVFEFLESPHKTSDKLLEEKAKAKKSKKAKKTSVKGSKKKASGQTPGKSPKGAKKAPRKKLTSDDEEDGIVEEDVEEEPEEKSDDDDYAERSASSKKRKRKTTKKQPMLESGDEEETPPKKIKPLKEEVKKKKKPIKEAKKEKKVKAKAGKSKEPSDEDLQEAICELLQNADFSKVTFTDVMKRLGEKFKVDLTHRKAHLKALIQEEIAKLVGEGDNEDEEGENADGEKVNGEQEDVSGDDAKGDDEDEDGEGAVGDEDGEKADGEDEDEDANSIENKADGVDDEDEDARDEGDDKAETEEDST
eukprot:c19722_g1_i1 orf=589-2037(-)